MKMAIYLSSICIFLFILAGPLDAYQKQITTKIKQGEYLREDYILKLKATKSPLKSRIWGTPQLVTIAQQTNGYLIQTILNFDEGGPEFCFAPNGEIISKGSAARRPTFEIIDSQSVKFGYDEFTPQIYYAVNVAEKYAEQVCLAGTYFDDNNKQYILNSNGTAVLPQGRITYAIGLLLPPQFSYDYFMSKPNEYSFYWQNDTLFLFDVSGGSLFEDGEVSLKSVRHLKRR
jgi:hypothetical protein